MARRPVEVVLKHEHGLDEARRRVQARYDKLKTQITGGLPFKFEENWETTERLAFTARGLGQKITGHIEIFPQHVRIEAILPGLLANIAETITGKLEKEGRVMIESKN